MQAVVAWNPLDGAVHFMTILFYYSALGHINECTIQDLGKNIEQKNNFLCKNYLPVN